MIAPASLSALSFFCGIGSGPAPALCTISPQNGWSPKKGTIMVGFPNNRPMAVVPAPPSRELVGIRGSQLIRMYEEENPKATYDDKRQKPW